MFALIFATLFGIAFVTLGYFIVKAEMEYDRIATKARLTLAEVMREQTY